MSTVTTIKCLREITGGEEVYEIKNPNVIFFYTHVINSPEI